jgi:hypothetical protein
MITRLNVENLLADGKLEFERPGGTWVTLTPSPTPPAARPVWELPFSFWHGALYGHGAITNDWFEDSGELRVGFLREKSNEHR